MRAPARSALAGLGLALLVGGVAGHVRLRNPATGKALEWSRPSVPLVLQLDGSDDVPDLSDDVALRLALADWSGLEGSALVLVEDPDPEQRARRDWRDTSLHTILFDETGASGLFLGGGIVALTPVTFTSGGRIVDADVLFNGRDHRFTTSGEAGAYDVQAIATHELGHVAGLDHSGWAGSTLYPYVEPGDVAARGLSEDELGGLRAIYPTAAHATLAGRVVRGVDGTPVAGAHVTARDAEGRPRRSGLSGLDGRFTLHGLDAGRYTVCVAPLDAPVAGFNLSGGQEIHTDFRARDDLGPVVVGDGGSASLGVLSVDPQGDLVLGRASDDLPKRFAIGATGGATVRGVGLVEGTRLEVSDPDLVLSNVTWNGGSVAFRLTVPAGESPGHVDLVARGADGDVAVLTAGLELAPVAPAITSVAPEGAGAAGGTTVVVTGAGFREGCRVVVGDRVYREGVPGGARLLAPNALELTLAPTVAGTHDVVVLDRTGVEGRLADALVVDGRPVVATVFPRAGQAAGGTRVRVTGAGFDEATRVLLDGVEQQGLRVVDATRLEFVTAAGDVGSTLLEVVDARGLGGATAFTRVATPDPRLVAVEPGEGERSGGETIDLAGLNLDPGCRVRFGVDAGTGDGGAEADVVGGDGDARLTVVTPGLAEAGLVAVAIEDPRTGQASLLEGGFLVRDEQGGGGGGCAAVVRAGSSGPGLRGALESGAWLLALAAIAAWQAWRGRRWLRSRGPVAGVARG